MKYDIRQAAQALISQLKAIDYERLPISKYNKRYIARLKPVLSYYMKIYADCLLKGLESIGSSPEEITLIDYGGGSGFLSILAKQAGIGRVIYIDLNPDSVDTIRILKELVNTGPDIILHGDSDTLADWCSANKVKPQLLIATDLIEHAYDHLGKGILCFTSALYPTALSGPFPCRSERSCTKDARTYLPTYPQGCQDRFLSSIERCFQHLRSTKRELDRTHLTHRNISLAGKTFRLSSPDRKRFLQHGSLQPDLHIHLLRYQRSDQDQRKSWFPICPVYNPAPTER